MITIIKNTQNDDKNEVIDFLVDQDGFNIDSNGITIKSKNEEFFLSITIDRQYDEYDPPDYGLYLFFNVNTIENDIYQIYAKSPQIKNERIGWLFPFTALTSKDHSMKNNVHYLKYACVAIRKLFLSQKKYKSVQDESLLNSSPEIDISYLFPPAVSLLVLCNKKLKDSKPEEFFLDLLYYGYIPYEFSRSIQNEFIGKENLITLRESQKLKECPKIVCSSKANIIAQHKEFYERLQLILSIIFFQNYNKNEVIRFFYLYQLIELIIEVIFDFEINEHIDSFTRGDLDCRSIREKFSDTSKEISRIKSIFNKYCHATENFTPIYGELSRIYSLFFDAEEAVKDVAKIIYKFRNSLFHSFIKHEKKTDILQEFNDSFEKLVLEMVKNLKFPPLSVPINTNTALR